MMNFLIFILGLVIGSFLNVLIFRLPRPEISKYRNTVRGRSFCPNCQKTISWHDNIPLISFLFLKGRCRNCKSKISRQYPLVELFTAFLFFISFLIYGQNPVFLLYVLFLISLFTVIAAIDLKHFLILDSLVLIGFLVSLLYFLFFTAIPQPAFGGAEPSTNTFYFSSALYGLLFFAGIFLLLFLASRGRWLGFGDVKLAALLGFIFGLEGAVNIFYLTFLSGFIVAIILLVLKKADLKTQIPLGSIMAGSSILFLLSGFNILDLMDSELIFRLWNIK